jgi:nucleoside-diphosphate kinase
MPRTEESLVLLKPDAIERGLCGEILRRLEATGLRLAGIRSVRFSLPLYNQHYAELKAKNLTAFERGREYFVGREVIAVRVAGSNAIAKIRSLVGPTDPLTAPPGTVRGDLSNDSFASASECVRSVFNLVHASDSPASARRELKLWFS